MNIQITDGENGKKTIEVDLLGAMMSQFMADKLWAVINTSGASCVDIHLHNVSVAGGSLPRFVLDYGQLYETLCEVAKEYRDYKREVEGLNSQRGGKMDTRVHFEAELTKRLPVQRWPKSKGLGLRVVKAPGDVVHAGEAEAANWLDGLWQKLPDDACVVETDMGLMTLDCVSSAYYDRYNILLASASWSNPTEDGRGGFDVPEFVLDTHSHALAEAADTRDIPNAWTCDNHAEPITYTDGTIECYCGRGRA